MVSFASAAAWGPSSTEVQMNSGDMSRALNLKSNSTRNTENMACTSYHFQYNQGSYPFLFNFIITTTHSRKFWVRNGYKWNNKHISNWQKQEILERIAKEWT